MRWRTNEEEKPVYGYRLCLYIMQYTENYLQRFSHGHEFGNNSVMMNSLVKDKLMSFSRLKDKVTANLLLKDIMFTHVEFRTVHCSIDNYSFQCVCLQVCPLI